MQPWDILKSHNCTCSMDLNDTDEDWRRHMRIRELRLLGCGIAASDAATTASMAGHLRVLHLVR